MPNIYGKHNAERLFETINENSEAKGTIIAFEKAVKGHIKMMYQVYYDPYTKERVEISAEYISDFIALYMKRTKTKTFFDFRKDITGLVLGRGKARGESDTRELGGLDYKEYCLSGIKIKAMRLYNHYFKKKFDYGDYKDGLIDFIVYFLAYHKLLKRMLLYKKI